MPIPNVQDAPLFVVLNRGSGKHRASQVRSAIEAASERAGRAVSFYPIGRGMRGSPQTAARQALRDAQQVGGVVVAAGGDGTINAVANVVYGSGSVLGVLPQGTFNYFGRTHGIPQTIDESLHVLLTGHPQPVQVGRINGRVFLVNASLGLYARLLQEREQIKSRFGRSRWIALCAAALTILRGTRQWQLEISEENGQTRQLMTPTLFVGNNALQLEQVGLPEAQAVKEGRLAALYLRAQSRLTMFGLLFAAGFGRLGEADAVEHFSFRRLRVSARRRPGRRVKIATDGELCWARMPLTFEVGGEPMWLIKPDPADARPTQEDAGGEAPAAA